MYGFLSSGYTFVFCFGWPKVRASRPLPRCLMRARLVSRLRCTRSTATSARRRSRSSPSRRRRARPPEAHAPTRVPVLVPHGRGGAGWPTLALCCTHCVKKTQRFFHKQREGGRLERVRAETGGGAPERGRERDSGRQRGGGRERGGWSQGARERERQRETQRGR